VDIIKQNDVFKKITALLVVVSENPSQKHLANQKADELEGLCTTVGIKVADKLFFNIKSFNSSTFIGSGQVEKIVEVADSVQANLVVFNNSLSPRIQRNLEEITNICVVDRQEIILQIFANRATTKEARLQVELAQLQYSMPRLNRKWANLSQQRGGVRGSKGSGEKQLELDRRTASARINRLKAEIAEISKQRDVQRRNRTINDIKNIAIVGYTNSGKSTFINRISDANVLSENKLFATLDPTTRRVFLPNGTKALFTDTVGFVSDLPHELVDAFKSTLEEAVIADFLLIVLDASSTSFLTHWDTTVDVLKSLNAFDKPYFILLNKSDSISEENKQAVDEFMSLHSNSLLISVLKDESMVPVLSYIEKNVISFTK